MDIIHVLQYGNKQCCRQSKRIYYRVYVVSSSSESYAYDDN